MSVSITDMLTLNEKKPVLNRYLKFFSYGGKQYGYLNRMPYSISFMELGEEMKKVLDQFDGRRSVNDIIVSNSLDCSFFDAVKIFYKNHLISENTDPHGYPVSNSMTLTFFPTTACGLRCLYCYISDKADSLEMISLEKAEAWINYVFERREDKIDTINVMFHGGGEPTIGFGRMKKIWELVKQRCIDEGLQYHLSSITNGTFNSEVLKWFIEEKAFLIFSIDGSEKFHDKLRPFADGKGSFSLAFNNLKKISDAGLSTGIRATVSSINLHHLRDLVDLCKECGVSFLNLTQCTSYGRPENMNDTSVSNAEFIKEYMDIWEYAMKAGVNLNGYASISVQPGRNYFCSDYSETAFSLTSDGFLTPCTEVVKKSDTASEAFFTGEINKDNTIIFYDSKINRLKQRNSVNIEECRSCFLEHVCNSGCAVKSFRSEGTLSKIYDEECKFFREISPMILKSILDKAPELALQRKAEYLDYKYPGNQKINSRYMSFNSLNSFTENNFHNY